jgi:Ca-activated chloride channel family protein
MSLPLLTISSQLAREPLPVTGAQQIAFALVDVRGGAALGALPRRPLNVALVLDRSGSMRGPRLQQMKAAVKQFIQHLTPEDILAIVAYDDMVQLVAPAGPVADPAATAELVELVEEGGGTAMGLGLSLGLAEVRRHATPERLNRILLLTDGTTDDGPQCLTLADEAGAEGISIAPIGFGAEWDDALLEGIGTRSGGPPPDYVRAPGDIGAAFLRHLQAARAVVAPGLRLDIRCVAGVTPRRVTRVLPFLRTQDDSITERNVTMRLGDLAADTPQTFVLELLVEPKRAGTFRIAQIESSSAGGEAHSIARGDIVVAFSPSVAAPPIVQPIVVFYVERSNAARIVLRALDDPTTASAIAPAVAQLFDPAGREQLDLLRAGHPLSPEGRKILLANIRHLTSARRAGGDESFPNRAGDSRPKGSTA